MKKVKKTKKRSKKRVENEPKFYTKEEYQRAVKYYENKLKERKTSSNDQA